MDSTGVPAGYVALFYLFMLVIWAAFGLWAGKVGQGKGYNFWIGFAAGFFGGIIGLVIMYAIKPAKRRVEPYQVYPPPDYYQAPPPDPSMAARHKVCNSCQNLVPGESQFCTYCGADLTATPPW